MDGQMKRQTSRCRDVKTDKWADGRMDGSTDKQMDG